MERRKPSLVFLDTHIIVWLYDALLDKFSPHAQSILENGDIKISPMSILELQYLYEIKKVLVKPKTIIHHLEVTIDLKKDETHFSDVVAEAMSFTWTRDPFDRIIVAQAKCNKAHLVTADHMIQAHYPLSVI